MGRAKWIERAFSAKGESVKAAGLTDGADTLAAPGQNFMGVRLMTDVPDNAVFRCVKNIVQRNGQFDYAETGSKMPAGDGSGMNGFGAQFI